MSNLDDEERERKQIGSEEFRQAFNKVSLFRMSETRASERVSVLKLNCEYWHLQAKGIGK